MTTDLDRYLWNSYLGRVHPDQSNCTRCHLPLVHVSDWWTDTTHGDIHCPTGEYHITESA